jgi:ribosomal protein S18 acetylase RimI-like enzyme
MAQTMDNTYFLWQIGVDPDLQGRKVARRLLSYVEDDLKKSNFRRIELTIDPENKPSIRLFEKHGFRNISRQNGKTTMFNGNEAVINFYRPGRHFMVMEKRL